MDLDALRATGNTISVDPLDTDAYRRDLWPRDTLRMYARGERPDPPAVIAWPTEVAHVEAAMDWAVGAGVPVVPFGAGSGVCGSATGRAGSLVIDLKRMNRIHAIYPEARSVHVESGILGQHLEDQLAQTGWMTAHSPSSIMCSTVGGYVAARSAGQFSSRYGVFDDMLLGARTVTPSGTQLSGVWTPDGSEDLLPMICGSEGGLGVVTDCLVRIAPLPGARWLRGFAFPDLETAWAAMRTLMQAGLWPSVLRLYDPVDTRVGGRASASEGSSTPSILSRLQDAVRTRPALQRRLLDLPLALPRLVNRIASGLGDEVLLIVGFEGPIPVVNASAATATQLLADARDLGPEPGEHWFAHRHDVSYKLAPIFLAGAFADTMEVAATWSRLPELHDRVRAALGRHAMVMAHFSHAYNEGCSIYFSFVGAGDLSTYDRTWTGALQAALDAGGTCTHHHGVGVLKAEAATREAGHAARVWNAVKADLDPSGIMNPGRPFVEVDDLKPGPPKPEGGPVFAMDTTSRLAEVDPHAPVDAIETALEVAGHRLSIRPDRPLAQWLPALQRDALEQWEVPLFAVQARFPDGVSARIGPAPRSAAGPDLRWSLMRRAHLESVQVPIRPIEDCVVLKATSPTLDVRDARPAWAGSETWGFSPDQHAIADVSNGLPTTDEPPLRAPTRSVIP